MAARPGAPPPEGKPTVSPTSISRFYRCPRGWMLHYRSDYLPESEVWEVRRQAHLTTLPALAGAVVHSTITTGLRYYAERQRWPADMASHGVRALDECLHWSQEWCRVVREPGRPWSDAGPAPHQGGPLDRHYYFEPVPGRELVRYQDSVRAALATFMASPVRRTIERYRPRQWRLPAPAGETPWFPFGGMVIYTRYDLGIVAPGECLIFEWKTGRRQRGEQDAWAQLVTYGAYAISRWQALPRDIHLCAVWLSEGQARTEIDLTVEALTRARASWRRHHEDVLQRTARVEAGASAAYDEFPSTREASRCAHCRFHACEGYREYWQRAARAHYHAVPELTTEDPDE